MNKTKTKTKDRAVHPARFSAVIIDYFREVIPVGTRVHDPFGGTGERLGMLSNTLGLEFTGTELEASFIKDLRVLHGNSTDPATYPTGKFWIVTSPPYGNGISDHFHAQDASSRKTYRAAIASIEGQDRPLHADNLGRYGFRGTGPGSGKRQDFWRIASEVVACWGGADRVLLNVSDFLANGTTEPHAQEWVALMEAHGWVPLVVQEIITPRYKNGADSARDERALAECVIAFKKAA